MPGGALILLDGPTIAAVLPGDAAAPEGYQVTDRPQATALPGLIDMHVHLCADSGVGALDRVPGYNPDQLRAVIEDSLRVQLSVGVTTVRDLGDHHYAVVDWRDSVGSAGRGWPTVVAAGPPITSVGGHCWSMGGAVSGPAALRAAVAEHVEHGVDLVKVMASGGFMTVGTEVMHCQFTAEEMVLLVEEVHAAGLRITAHAHGLPAAEQVMAAGVDGIEHGMFLTERGPRMSEENLALLAEWQIAVCPTLGVRGALMPPPHMLEVMTRAGLTPESFRQARLDQARRMTDAGVLLVSGSDGGINPAKPHGLLPESLEELVIAGMPTRKALSTATSVAARVAGLGDRKGRLQAGFDADLLLVDGDPLDDIRALRAVAAVFVGGRRERLVDGVGTSMDLPSSVSEGSAGSA
nr:amidohydrolase family protein [Microlunatus panaciterrae]